MSAQIKRDMDNDRYRLDSLKNELRDLDEQARARAASPRRRVGDRPFQLAGRTGGPVAPGGGL